MKNLLSRTLLAAAGATLITQAAHAQLNYQDQDLILGFQTVTSGSHGNTVSGNDLVIDIGAASTYANATSPFAVPGLSATDISSLNGGSLNNQSWAVVGTINNANNANADTLWLSKARPSAGTPSAPWANLNGFGQAPGSSKVTSIGLGYNTYTPGATPTSAIEGSGDATSYSHFMGPNGNLTASWSGNLQQKNSATFTTGGPNFSYLDLYQVAPSDGANPGVNLLGYFQLGSDASLEFIPVPEPSTYGLVAGAGLLAICLRNQLRRKQA